MPLTLDGGRLPLRSGPPPLGAQTTSILHSLGLGSEKIEALRAAGVGGRAGRIGGCFGGAATAIEPRKIPMQ